MGDALATAIGYLERAKQASAVFEQLDQEQTDAIVEAVFKAGFNNRIRLARLAVEETGIGIFEHKVLKNVVASQLVYESIRNERTVGVLSHDEFRGITEIAQPIGPILAVTPVTNPTSTVIFKTLIALKSRNAIIFSPHKSAVKCCAEAARICYEAALAADAPEFCVQCIESPSRDLTQAIMTHTDLALVLATGGPSLVKAAYSSGTPAIGVGPGNVPVYICGSADIPFAVESIIVSKTFDNGTICASEQSVVVEKRNAEAVMAEFTRQGCLFLNLEETARLAAFAVNPETGLMNPAVVGQSVRKIAEAAGIPAPEGTKILLARLHGVGREHPLSGEILAPVLAFYVEDDFNAAIKRCIDINYLSGIGHTASIYSNDENKIREFSNVMNAGRIVVNTPSSQGGVGGIYNNLKTSLTLGCGTGGNNITTENITATHLINIMRICRRRNNERWARFDTNQYLDESLEVDEIMKRYNKNY